ncbi:MAG: phosphodiesterase [Bacteroidetes bacterium]|nr:MAG: phosphodiesterase [Bacteroidota bacterium]
MTHVFGKRLVTGLILWWGRATIRKFTLLSLLLGSCLVWFLSPMVSLKVHYPPTKGNTVTIFLIDGLSKHIFQEMVDQGKLPHLRELIRKSTLVKHGIAAFPTMTGYGFYPFITGEDAARSGILGLRWFDRSRENGNLRNYVGRTNVLMNEDIHHMPQTVFERYDSFYTASVNTYMNRGVHDAEMTGWAHATSKYQSEGVFKMLRHIPLLGRRIAKDHFQHESMVLEKALEQLARNPKVQWITFPGPDASNHVLGTTDEYYRLLVHLDSLIGRFVSETAGLGQGETRMIAIVTDHGISDVSVNLDIPGRLEKEFGIALERGPSVNLYTQTLKDPISDFVSKQGYFVINGNLSAYIYLRDPVLNPTAQHWRNNQPFDLLTHYPARNGAIHLPETIASMDGVELVACRPNDSTVTVYGKNGHADIIFNGTDAYRYVPAGRDPFGYDSIPALNILLKTGFHSADQWLDASLETRFPDALYRLYSVMAAKGAGDLLVTAEKGYDLAPDYEMFVQNYKGGHGGLRGELSDVPYILYIPGTEARVLPYARAEDVGRIILNHLEDGAEQ